MSLVISGRQKRMNNDKRMNKLMCIIGPKFRTKQVHIVRTAAIKQCSYVYNHSTTFPRSISKQLALCKYFDFASW